MRRKPLRAIDLYAGVGGWSLGLMMSGVKVVRSYELWENAARTYEKNLRAPVELRNIRNIKFKDLPKDIDIVVGSPPCIEFSYSNRGGKGDITDGLRDIAKFLRIVQYVKPKFWVMENVPRIKSILDEELAPGGVLSEFRTLQMRAEIVDMSEFGLPQRRKRCIAGNFDFDLLLSYREKCRSRTLGRIVHALDRERVVDPIYGVTRRRSRLFDHDHEQPLSAEEKRMNHEVKAHHPVYNGMRFPDCLVEPVRTITATCTRVSRESVVIKTPHTRDKYRRLSIREKATLQGFPISFQFFGESYSQKLTMVGNALPPLFACYVGQAMRRVRLNRVKSPAQYISRFTPPRDAPKVTPPHGAISAYREDRRFRFSLPNLRFKSGVGFELANGFERRRPTWTINFVHGNSKDIKYMRPNAELVKRILREHALRAIRPRLQNIVARTRRLRKMHGDEALQRVWTRDIKGHHPFRLMDTLGGLAKTSASRIRQVNGDIPKNLVPAILKLKSNGRGLRKLERHADKILAGFIVAGSFNGDLRKTTRTKNGRPHSKGSKGARNRAS